ncbi:MAG TPA: polyprenyl diphosphate synthase [Candidatus Nanoarchaeia archaeon]|nr:polyprenyl diphosphate synthase [Candidatus Nanoarchaeia archaeon]
MEPTNNKVPKHIGIILDGNRRFAKRLMLKPLKGHEWGYEKIKKIMEWCKEFNIKELTLYTFSIENFDRPKKEFDYLMKLFVRAFKELKNDWNKIKELKVRFIGRIFMFPEKVQQSMKDLMESTINNGPYTLNFAMAYGGRAEIVDATKKIAQQVKEGKLDIDNINEENFKKNLYLDSDPDLIIRTSESRLSGFLLYQGAYSEIIFLPEKLWPEFEKEDFVKCLEEYSNRERRFGK